MNQTSAWVAAIVLLSAVYATGTEEVVDESKTLKGKYLIYAGELGEEMKPAVNDRKMAIEITGLAAKDIVESMYPDFQPTCSGEKGDRDRRKGKLSCSFSPPVGYRCFLGLDLRTGKSIAGARCRASSQAPDGRVL